MGCCDEISNGSLNGTCCVASYRSSRATDGPSDNISAVRIRNRLILRLDLRQNSSTRRCSRYGHTLWRRCIDSRLGFVGSLEEMREWLLKSIVPLDMPAQLPTWKRFRLDRARACESDGSRTDGYIAATDDADQRRGRSRRAPTRRPGLDRGH